MPDGLPGLRDELERALSDLVAATELVRTFEIPDFHRETEYVSLKGKDQYPFIGGRLVSSDGIEKAEQEYAAMTNEYVDQRNTSKWCKLYRESFAVGGPWRDLTITIIYSILRLSKQHQLSALSRRVTIPS